VRTVATTSERTSEREHLDLHPPPVARPAVDLFHRDPPLAPTRFFFHPVVFVVTIGLVVGLATAAAIDGGSLLDTLDRPVARWISDHRTPTWTHLFNVGSHLGDNIVVFGLAAVAALLTVRRCRYLALALLAAAAVRPAVEFVLKAVVSRARPDIDPLGHFQGPSHPSGHPLAAASLWGLMPAFAALHVRSRIVWWASVGIGGAIVVIVAAARVYKGAHYLTDVIASLAWAGLYLACVQGGFDRLHHERDCAHPQHEVQAST
jgi:membrane-associated phospholipid phosphatase